MFGSSFVASAFLLATTETTSTKQQQQQQLQRKFQYVPYGSSFSPSVKEDIDRPTISCDGRIPGGVSLELTHWTDNETPTHLYADTSTEMALNLAKQQSSSSYLPDALILNNHYDTDGVLSVWACLEPDLALSYSDLLINGAEAGDFGEWNSNNGVKLDCALNSLWQQDEALAYENSLRELPTLLEDLHNNDGLSFIDLWKDEWEKTLSDWNDFKDGRVSVEPYPDSKLILVHEASASFRLSPYALHRAMKETGLLSGTTRILRVSPVNGSQESKYQYEKVGHGWVQKLVRRHTVPSVDASELVTELNNKTGDSNSWITGGSSGLVSICQTSDSISTPTEKIANLLVELDPGCQT